MGIVQESYRQMLCESTLKTMGVTKEDGLIYEAAQEIFMAAAYEPAMLNEAAALSMDQINQLFTAASDIATSSPKEKPAQNAQPQAAAGQPQAAPDPANDVTGGQEPKKNHIKQIAATIGKWQNKLMGKAADTDTGKKLNAGLEKLLGTIDSNADKIPGGPAMVATAKKIGELAKKHPKSAAFATAALAGLGGALTANPLAGAAIGKGLQAALGVMKGEKATDILVKGGTAMAVGALAGAIADTINADVSGDPKTQLKVTSQSEGAPETSGSGEAAQAIADMTEEEYRKAYAEAIWKNHIVPRGGLGDYQNLEMDEGTIARMAKDIKINGDFESGNYTANFDGKFVLGGHYLSPEQAKEFTRLVQSQSGVDDVSKMFQPEVKEWLAQNAPKSGGVDFDSERYDADRKAEYDAMSPEEQAAHDNREKYTRAGDW